MDIIQEIKNFVPLCPQEQRDKAGILRFLAGNPDAFERENLTAHMTASAWVLSPDRRQVVMVYHNIYNSWSWTGGHADGDRDLLAVAMREVTEELEPVAQDADIALLADVAEDVRLEADASLLTRLAVNLLSNAIRYGRPGGHAWLVLRRAGDEVLLSVRDDGAGMTQQEQSRMWDRFWRADSSRHSEGTGLGLSIAKWIIDQHGGRAEVRSAPGEGTEVRVFFPAKK